jgi:endogenous inhibitor of DNA gyrase (YacG/DUF329 family)
MARDALTCPICRRKASEAYRPFCTKRCADIDLSRWLNGVYAIPACPHDEQDDDESVGSGRPRASPPADGRKR